ncbi:unnamed protein product [Soboliphyme baturini]|uniref:Uncharacterized protein n=1 Tax=Soboliphyme baturini TaxID=241478 RepID=A0A183I9S7_9BILA|nr:unnamed protein product [Soboliphyme baturini]
MGLLREGFHERQGIDRFSDGCRCRIDRKPKDGSMDIDFYLIILWTTLHFRRMQHSATASKYIYIRICPTVGKSALVGGFLGEEASRLNARGTASKLIC